MFLPASQFEVLAHELLDAFQVSGIATLPRYRREDVVALLNTVIRNRVHLETYTALLFELYPSYGLTPLAVARAQQQEWPEDEIIAEGFSGLNDTLLAELALSATDVVALGKWLNETAGVTPGTWYYDLLNGE